jgi:hypothetical protein
MSPAFQLNRFIFLSYITEAIDPHLPIFAENMLNFL